MRAVSAKSVLVLVAVMTVYGLLWSMLSLKETDHSIRAVVTQVPVGYKMETSLRHTEPPPWNVSYNTCHVTHSCPECPDLNAIPNLVNDRPMMLSESPTEQQLDERLCPDQTWALKHAVSAGNARLQGLALARDTNSRSSLGQPQTQQRLPSHGVPCTGDYLNYPGGHWVPATCQPKWKVAIAVPYRNRTFQLSIFLRYMVPFLQKQQLEFAIYIVNQANELAFNRGMLLNIGFLEALKFTDWDCFVFHDVDHLPQSEFNPYGCVDLPRHFIGGADNRNYKVPYSTSFGGVSGLTTAQFRTINGFSNKYWGWCCEDDDIELRLRMSKLQKTRYKGPIGYYRALRHNKIRNSKSNGLEKRNRALLKESVHRLRTDGLSYIRYHVKHLQLHTLYTNISVDIQMLV